jgi:hypothetical protein
MISIIGCLEYFQTPQMPMLVSKSVTELLLAMMTTSSLMGQIGIVVIVTLEDNVPAGMKFQSSIETPCHLQHQCQDSASRVAEPLPTIFATLDTTTLDATNNKGNTLNLTQLAILFANNAHPQCLAELFGNQDLRSNHLWKLTTLRNSDKPNLRINNL